MSYLITLVSMVPMVVIFGQIKDAAWRLFTPMLGQLMVITRILRGDRSTGRISYSARRQRLVVDGR